MPRLINRQPKYRKHKASGQAVVTLSGRDFYLGRHGSKASQIEYDRLLAEWMKNGRSMPEDASEGATVVELAADYWRHSKSYYVKDGEPTDEQASIRVTLRFLRQHSGHVHARDFGPLALKGVRQVMIEAGHSRDYINKNIGRIRRAFKWGVEQEQVPVSVYQALMTVQGLRRGKSAARETEPVRPVSDATIETTLAQLPRRVADMVRIQRLTGSRPSEICIIRPCDLDRSGKVWRYQPESHKMEHRGKERVIFLGPKAQKLLLPYLSRETSCYCFQPSRGSRRRFTKDSYRAAIRTALKQSTIPN